MKKKGPRSIPDFSVKRKGPVEPDLLQAKTARQPVPRPPVIKPKATSSKSGRRGS